MNKLVILLFVFSIFGCKPDKIKENNGDKLNDIAEQYVRLGLEIGQYDADFVDAYYGPDSLKPVGEKQGKFPKDDFIKKADELISGLKELASENGDEIALNRTAWLIAQLTAFKERCRIFSGEYSTFDKEAQELFGVIPSNYEEDYFKDLLSQMDDKLPGEGNIKERFQQFSKKFIIPKAMVDTVFRTSINESRKRTLAHYKLPSNENFKLEYVTDKPWSGYNWYKGNYQSVIQFNADIAANIEKAIDIAAHEGYPGHHVYNSLLEQKLYNEKGWVEISLYPLFSPQSLIAEGSANFGIEVVFPSDDSKKFAEEILMPLAKMDTIGLNLYFELLEIKSKLAFADIEIARRLLDGKIDEKEAIRWMTEYILMDQKTAERSLSFKKKYRTYVMNYTFGQELVRKYINKNGGDENNLQKRWDLFEKLLSSEVRPADL